MQANMYSNVGFRCESAYLAFNSYLQSKQVNKIILEDSKKILADCLQIKEYVENSLYMNEARSMEIESLNNILFDYILAQDDKKTVFIKLKRIHSNIGKIENLQKKQVDELCVFFKELVNICKNRSQYSFFQDEDG